MGDRRRVVVTGIGPVTPVGIGVDDFWAGMTSGRNGVRTITQFDTSDLPVTVAGEVADFDAGRLPGHEGGSSHRPVLAVRDRVGLARVGRRGHARGRLRARRA